MKMIGILMIFFSCSACGFWMDFKEKKRIKELEQWVYGFELLKAEIDFRLSPMQEACKQVARFMIVPIEKVFLTFAKQLEERSTSDSKYMWKKALDESKTLFILREEDYKLLQEFGDTCGYLDKNMQEKSIDMLLEKLKKSLKDAQKHYERAGRVNQYIGIVIGACISIFLL